MRQLSRRLLAALCGTSGLVACSLASEGTGVGPTGPDLQGAGGSGAIEAGAGGAGPNGQGGGGSPAAGAGAGGVAGAGAGGVAGGTSGTGGAGGAGQGGGGSGGSAPTLPDLLQCTPWLPGNAAWVVAGDARNEATRLVLTPPDAPNRQGWGHVRLPMEIDAEDSIEVAFMFVIEPAPGGTDFATGASFWFGAQPDALLAPQVEGLGVPSAGGGVALGLDLRPTTFAKPGPFWGLYASSFNDGLVLSDYVATELTNAFSPLGAAPLGGPHVALLQMRRETSGSGEDDVVLEARLGEAADAPSLSALFPDGSDETFGAGFLGFGAESRAGATHVLVGAQVKVDGACVAPPPLA